MSWFTEHRAEAIERGEGPGVLLTWGAARNMLPLVSRIAQDIADCDDRLACLRVEKARLDRLRDSLAWPERARRYELNEEIATRETELRQLRAELEAIGVVLLEARTGLVGFPTIVNDRAAFFSWRPGEETLGWWNFAEDLERRPVPEQWTVPPREVRLTRRPRSR
jgi:hypothetical protein